MDKQFIHYINKKYMNHRDSERLRGRDKQYNYFKGFNQVDNVHPNIIPVPDCSDVRQNLNSDNLLAGSELSLLQRFAEINDRMCDSALMNEKEEEIIAKSTSDMRFSFNKNSAFPVSNQGNTSRQTTNRSSTLKDIYYKEFQKQSSRIKDVQEARKKLLTSVNEKRIVRNGNKGKQNLVGSIKRKNYTEDKANLNNAYSKSTLHSEALTQINRNAEAPREEIGRQDEEEALSLKYLQESLAKGRDVRIPLTKVSYLQANSSNKQPTFQNLQTNIQVKQFNEREEQFVSYLQELFDQLDMMKAGKLNRENCQYMGLRQQFKIGFGYILIRIKMKELILNKEEFVRLGLQTIRQLDSEEFNRLLKDIKKAKQYTSVTSTNNMRLEETIKRNYQERELAKNRSRYLANRDIDQSPRYLKLGAKDVEDYHEFLTKVENKYESMPMFGQTTTKKEPIERYRYPQQDFVSSVNFIAQVPEIQTQHAKHIQDRNYKSQPKNHSEQRQVSRLMTFNEQQFANEVIPPAKKKVRNISQAMILQHKRNLELIARLRQQVQSCLTNSRRVLEERSVQKYQRSYSPEPPAFNIMEQRLARGIIE